jgi:hypothetical protein
MVNTLAIFHRLRRRGTGKRASCRPRCITLAARSARPRRRIRQWRSGEAVPGDDAAPCLPPSSLLAADARVLFPIARVNRPGFPGGRFA